MISKGRPFSSTTVSSHVFTRAHADAFSFSNSLSSNSGTQNSFDTDVRISPTSTPRCKPEMPPVIIVTRVAELRLDPFMLSACQPRKPISLKISVSSRAGDSKFIKCTTAAEGY
jgi:hypothetical protein